jgi:hypothetical protein
MGKSAPQIPAQMAGPGDQGRHGVVAIERLHELDSRVEVAMRVVDHLTECVQLVPADIGRACAQVHQLVAAQDGLARGWLLCHQRSQLDERRDRWVENLQEIAGALRPCA